MSLQGAAYSGDTAATRALLAEPTTDPNATDDKGCTALHAAAGCDEAEVGNLETPMGELPIMHPPSFPTR